MIVARGKRSAAPGTRSQVLFFLSPWWPSARTGERVAEGRVRERGFMVPTHERKRKKASHESTPVPEPLTFPPAKPLRASTLQASTDGSWHQHSALNSKQRLDSVCGRSRGHVNESQILNL